MLDLSSTLSEASAHLANETNEHALRASVEVREASLLYILHPEGGERQVLLARSLGGYAIARQDDTLFDIVYNGMPLEERWLLYAQATCADTVDEAKVSELRLQLEEATKEHSQRLPFVVSAHDRIKTAVDVARPLALMQIALHAYRGAHAKKAKGEFLEEARVHQQEFDTARDPKLIPSNEALGPAHDYEELVVLGLAGAGLWREVANFKAHYSNKDDWHNDLALIRAQQGGVNILERFRRRKAEDGWALSSLLPLISEQRKDGDSLALEIASHGTALQNSGVPVHKLVEILLNRRHTAAAQYVYDHVPGDAGERAMASLAMAIHGREVSIAEAGRESLKFYTAPNLSIMVEELQRGIDNPRSLREQLQKIVIESPLLSDASDLLIAAACEANIRQRLDDKDIKRSLETVIKRWSSAELLVDEGTLTQLSAMLRGLGFQFVSRWKSGGESYYDGYDPVLTREKEAVVTPKREVTIEEYDLLKRTADELNRYAREQRYTVVSVAPAKLNRRNRGSVHVYIQRDRPYTGSTFEEFDIARERLRSARDRHWPMRLPANGSLGSKIHNAVNNW